jgi:hypothetical protein
MIEMQGVNSSPDARVLMLGATNLPYNLDQAIRRRFDKVCVVCVCACGCVVVVVGCVGVAGSCTHQSNTTRVPPWLLPRAGASHPTPAP